VKKNKKILITGGTGLVGNAFSTINIKHTKILIGSSEYDLRNASDCEEMYKKYAPDHVIHLAAKVGGVSANSNYLADFYTDNTLINTNVLRYAQKYKVEKLVSLLSTCIYPDKVNFPLTEEQIHNGSPHNSNYGYAYAKRMLDVQSRVYRDQYGCNFITAIPNNLFGPNDNFDLQNSHVIPAIIHKVYDGRKNNSDVELWGDGTPLREFTYSLDLAKILLFLLEEYDELEPINVGNTEEYDIKTVAKMICNNLDYDFKRIKWNVNKPSGQYKKPSCNKKLLEIGWKKEEYTSLKDGLKKTCKWFIMNYPFVRGNE
jgi:GDP-L-fucose synthase